MGGKASNVTAIAGGKATRVAAIAGAKATRSTVITDVKDKVTAITGSKETGVTAGACVEGARKKRDQDHENIKHGRVSGCVDLCSDILVSTQLMLDEDLESASIAQSAQAMKI